MRVDFCAVTKDSPMKRILVYLICHLCCSVVIAQAPHSGFVFSKKFRLCSDAVNGVCPHRFEKDGNEAFRMFKRNNTTTAAYYSGKAIAEGERAGEDVSWLYYLNAQLKAKQGNYAGAADEMSLNGVIIGEFPFYNHGIYALKAGDYPTALSALTNHLSITNDLMHETQWGKGIAYLNMGLADSAQFAFNAALEVRDNPEVRLGLINALVLEGRRSDALDYARAAVRKYPLHKNLREALKNIQSNLTSGGFAHFYTSVLASMTISRLEINRANQAFVREQYNRANRMYKHLLRKNPDDREAHLGSVNVLLAQGKYSEARTKLNALLLMYPNELRFHEAIGILDYTENRWDSAMVHLAKAAANPQMPLTYDAYLAAGTILYSRNSIAPAYNLFAKAVSVSNTNSWAHAGMAMCLISLNDFRYSAALRKEARVHLFLARLKSPADPILLMYSGITEYYSGNMLLARNYFGKASDAHSSDAQMFNVWAMLESEQNNYEKAFELMDHARALAPEQSNYYVNSGVLVMKYATYIKDGDSSADISRHLTQMHAYYDTALTMGADSNVVNINRGVAYEQLREYDTALMWFSRVQSADTLVAAGSANNIGAIYALQGMRDEARMMFQEANEIDASNRYAFIDENSRRVNSNHRLFKKDFTFVYIFYIPSVNFRPDLNGDWRAPDGIPFPACPSEISEIHHFDVSCDAHQSFTLSWNKGQHVKKEKIRKTRIDACW